MPMNGVNLRSIRSPRPISAAMKTSPGWAREVRSDFSSAALTKEAGTRQSSRYSVRCRQMGPDELHDPVGGRVYETQHYGATRL